jgi:hypothetical protein
MADKSLLSKFIVNLLLFGMTAWLSACSTKNNPSNTQPPNSTKDFSSLRQINPKIGCRDSNAISVMKSQFELAGYNVAKVKTGGRHGTIGEIHLVIIAEEDISEITNNCQPLLNLSLTSIYGIALKFTSVPTPQ